MAKLIHIIQIVWFSPHFRYDEQI